MVIAVDGRACEVIEVRLRDDAGPTPPGRDRRAFRAHVRRLHGPPFDSENDRHECGLAFPAGWIYGFHVYPDGMVPLCSCCGHPWPCRNVEARRESQRAAELLDKRLAHIAPGTCYGCGEPITHRQDAVRYYEPNVQIPGAPPPVFHARKSCSAYVADYERDRLALEAHTEATS